MAPSDRYLTNTHAVVTGGGRGIGAAIATELARRGASLTLMGRDDRVLAEHAARLTSDFGVPASHVACDVADEGSVARAFAAARATLGDPHVLVSNAGQADAASVAETTLASWERVLAVNLTGTFLCARAVLPAMLAARAGRIVNVASTAGLKGYAGLGAYCASKHGVVGLTRAMAMETAKLGVTVNAVCPSYTSDTGMVLQAVDNIVRVKGKSEEDARQAVTRTIPRGVLTTPEEVASAVGWLCSPGAAAVTGQAIAVAGGEVT